MSTLETRIKDALTVIGTNIKSVRTKISGNTSGDLSGLNTTAKTSLLAAINEVLTIAQGAGAINDSAATGTSTYSSNKIVALIATAKSEILGGASSAYDTLLEIQTILQNDDTSIANLLTAVGNRVRFDAAQTLTTPQQLQARQNINAYGADELGNPDADLAAYFTAALA